MPQRKKARTGELLQYWRRIRGRKQADLANAAATSTKHLSFIENNRALPSEDLLERLCGALDIPQHERIMLHRSAGIEGSHTLAELDDTQKKHLHETLELALHQLEPYPAVAFNRSFERIASNTALNRLIVALGGDIPYVQSGGINMIELLIREDGLRPFLKNWKDIAHRVLHRMYRDCILDDPHGELADELERLLQIEGIPEDWRTPIVGDSDPMVRFCFSKNDRDLTFDSIIATVGTPLDVNYQNVRMRYFLPVDDQTERFVAEVSPS